MASTRSSPVALRPGIAALASIVPLLLTGCSAEGDPAPAISPSTADSGERSDADQTSSPATGSGAASLVMAGESFAFTPAFCAIGESDILVHGPGQGNESGEPAYLQVDFVRESRLTAGAARVDLGATDQFTSSDAFYAFDTAFAGEHSLTIDGDSFELEGDFHSANGSPLGPGTLTVDCR